MVTTPTIPSPSLPARTGDHAPADGPEREPRRLGRRPSLPAGRAIVGGLLVTVAAIGTFAAYANATAGPTSTFVVAARPLRAGQRVEASDLRTVALELPSGLDQQAFSSPGELVGAIALAPIDADQLIAPAAVRVRDASGSSTAAREFSFALEREKALGGRIQRGELIDAVAIYGTGSDAYSRIVIRRGRVIDVDSGTKSTVGASAKVTITLALDTDQQVLEAMHAVEIAKLTLVRTTGDDEPAPAPRPGTGAAPGAASGTGPDGYRPVAPPDTAAASTGDGAHGSGSSSSAAADGSASGPGRSAGPTSVPAGAAPPPAAGSSTGAGT
jgi:Flp pilus assembly protein CpaB